MIANLFENKYLFGVLSGIGGMLLHFLLQRILNKRGLLRYFVNHVRVGVSTDDAVFGSVQITWNGNVMANLYLSTVELINESMNDYENVVVRVFTSDTFLLTERTEIVGTTHILNWTEDYSRRLQVQPGQHASEAQIALHSSQRDYLVPTMNRGQAVRFHFLNAARTQNQPSIWLDVLHRGIKLKFRNPQNQIFGVSQPIAALVGGLQGLIFTFLVVLFVKSVWVAAISSFLFGYLALIPGAFTLKSWRWLRDMLGG